MSAVQVFDFEDHPVRSLLRNDEPWFVAVDICRVLGISNPRDAVSKLDDDERDTVGNTDGIAARQVQSVNVVSESGLYALIFTSRKEEAKRFRKWVTSVVLPALRKTGSFILGRPDPSQLPSSEHGLLWGQPISKINSAANYIRAIEKIYGPEAARALVEQDPGLPQVSHLTIGAVTGRADDDAMGCWRHLMRSALGNGHTAGAAIDLLLRDKAVARSILAFGISAIWSGGPVRIAIASRNRFLASVFAETQWADDWDLALRQLPGASLSKTEIEFGDGGKSRAVLIPRANVLKLREG